MLPQTLKQGRSQTLSGEDNDASPGGEDLSDHKAWAWEQMMQIEHSKPFYTLPQAFVTGRSSVERLRNRY